MKRKVIPYDPHLKVRAKELRLEMTFSEVLLWNEIKNFRMMGYDFDRQRPIGHFIVDFYCKDLHLVLEVDVETHFEEGAPEKDQWRQSCLEKMGVRFLRFNAMTVIHKVDKVVREIQQWIIDYEEVMASADM